MKSKKLGVKVLSIDSSFGDLVVSFEIHKNKKSGGSKKLVEKTINFGKISIEQLQSSLLSMAESYSKEDGYEVPKDIDTLVGKFITKEEIIDSTKNTFE